MVYGRVLSGTAGRLNGICQQRRSAGGKPADDDAGDVLPGLGYSERGGNSTP